MPQSYTIRDIQLHQKVESGITNPDNESIIEYPIYIPSRHRFDKPITTKVFDDDNIPYRILVEPHDYDNYRARYDDDQLIRLPKDNQGIAYVRNYALEHARDTGHDYFWMFDDDIRSFQIRQDGKAIKTNPRPLLKLIENITNDYENIGGSCIAHSAFIFGQDGKAPVVYNSQIYCAELITTQAKARFRKGVADDIDFSMQLLHEGWVTLVYKRIGFTSATSGTISGGLVDSEYKEDGRLALFQQLQAYWPGAFNIGYHKDGRPHVISRNYYRHFTQRPRPKKQKKLKTK